MNLFPTQPYSGAPNVVVVRCLTCAKIIRYFRNEFSRLTTLPDCCGAQMEVAEIPSADERRLRGKAGMIETVRKQRAIRRMKKKNDE